MNKSQENAIAKFRRHMDEEVSRPSAGHERVVSRFEITEERYMLSVVAETDIPSLGEGNLLRALDRQHWHIFVGKRGKITAVSYPKSFAQFAPGRAFGITFKTNGAW